MNIVSRLVAIGLSLSLLIVIVELIRRKRLKERYALLWLLSGSCILLIAIFDNVLSWLTNLLGIVLPINMVFFFGFFFLILINLHFSLAISSLSEQNRIIAQKLAALEFNLSDRKKNK